jgi:hypothetical protein
MSTETMAVPTTATTTAATDPLVPIRAHSRVVKKLGHWTSARQLDVRASRGLVVLDLRSPQMAAGDIEVCLDIDHAVVKLLVADGAVIEDGDTRRVGRCRVRDWTGVSVAGGRRVVLSGEMRSAEVRVHRGGIAILSAMCSREYLADALTAHREGRRPTIDDPARAGASR